MTETTAVEQPVANPQGEEARPTQSRTQFPYYDLADAAKVAEAIHFKAGGECDRNQLGAFLGHKSVKSGAFLSRIAAAKLFGLIAKSHRGFRITARGKAIVAPVTPQDESDARVAAFLSVPLFQAVFERFEGSDIPNRIGLENLFATAHGVVKSRRTPTVRIMLRSAEYAGLFDTAGTSKMIRPVRVAEQPPADVPTQDSDGRIPAQGSGKGSGTETPEKAGGDQDVGSIDPALSGLLQRLPPGGTSMSKSKRDQLVKAFTSVVEFIYPDKEDDNG